MRNGLNFKLPKTMKLNTENSEPTHISPESELVKGPFRCEVKEAKEGDRANFCSTHRAPRSSAMSSTDPLMPPVRWPLPRRGTDCEE